MNDIGGVLNKPLTTNKIELDNDYYKIGPKADKIIKIKGVDYVEKSYLDTAYRTLEAVNINTKELRETYAQQMDEDSKKMGKLSMKIMHLESDIEEKEKATLEMQIEFNKQITKLKQENDSLEKKLYLKDNASDDIGNTRINF